MKVTVNGADISGSYTEQELEQISLELVGFDAEVGNGTLPHPDAAGTGEWYAGQTALVQDGGGPTTILDGFLGDQQRERGEAAIGPRRLESFNVEDTNALLYGRRALSWVRPAETDRARLLAFVSTFMGGLGINTTNVLNTNLATLPARTYTTEDVFSDLLTEIREATGKTIFMVRRELHSHQLGEGIAATISLIDGAPNYSTTWPVSVPRRSKDKGELANDIVIRNQVGGSATFTDATSITRHDSGGLKHQALVDTQTATADLPAFAAAFGAAHKDERLTYEVTTGPFTPAQTALLDPGMLIVVTSQAVGLSATTLRIARITWRYLHPGTWWADLDLGTPLRVAWTPRTSPGPPKPINAAASVVAGATCTATPEPHTVTRQVSPLGQPELTEVVSGVVAATSEFGSSVWFNSAYTTVGCPVGGGGWDGYADTDLGFKFTAPADAASFLGLLVTIDASAISKTTYTGGWVVRLLRGAMTKFGQGGGVAAGPESGSATIYLPRSAITWGGENWLIFHPDWLASRDAFFCNAAAYFGNPKADGRGASGAYGNLGISTLCAAVFAPGTIGIAPGVAGVGAVDGLNRLFTLISWTGAGPVGVTINGLEQPTGGLVLDAAARTATLDAPPPSGAIVLFTYPVSA